MFSTILSFIRHLTRNVQLWWSGVPLFVYGFKYKPEKGKMDEAHEALRLKFPNSIRLIKHDCSDLIDVQFNTEDEMERASDYSYSIPFDIGHVYCPCCQGSRLNPLFVW
jgi:hypothetical protein